MILVIAGAAEKRHRWWSQPPGLSVDSDLPGTGGFPLGEDEGQDAIDKGGLDGGRIEVRVQAQPELVAPGLGGGSMTCPVPGRLKMTVPGDGKEILPYGYRECFPGDARQGDMKGCALLPPGEVAGGACMRGIGMIGRSAGSSVWL